jgi:hypothetical protein
MDEWQKDRGLEQSRLLFGVLGSAAIAQEVLCS